jgi:hypothetical protein
MNDQHRQSLADNSTCDGCRQTATLVVKDGERPYRFYRCDRCLSDWGADQTDSEALEDCQCMIQMLELDLDEARSRIAELEARLAMHERLVGSS